MATHRFMSGEVIDVRPLGATLHDTKTQALFKTTGLEVIRLVLPQGEAIPPHHARGPITVQCLEGRIEFSIGEVKRELTAGKMLYLNAQEPHALLALEDSSVLVTLRLEH